VNQSVLMKGVTLLLNE